MSENVPPSPLVDVSSRMDAVVDDSSCLVAVDAPTLTQLADAAIGGSFGVVVANATADGPTFADVSAALWPNS